MSAPPILVKKSSLEGIADGFDDTCFAYVKPATYEDRKKFREAIDQTSSDTDAMESLQADLVASHFVGGKIKLLNPESGEFELVDMTSEHLTIGIVGDRLAMDIMGFDLDPKEWAAAVRATTPPQDETSTETPSSEA